MEKDIDIPITEAFKNTLTIITNGWSDYCGHDDVPNVFVASSLEKLIAEMKRKIDNDEDLKSCGQESFCRKQDLPKYISMNYSPGLYLEFYVTGLNSEEFDTEIRKHFKDL